MLKYFNILINATSFISAALSGIMIMAANDILEGKMSVGSLVNINICCLFDFKLNLNACPGNGKWSSLPTVRSSRVSGLSVQRGEASLDRHAGKD